jgi:hypothetical protein
MNKTKKNSRSSFSLRSGENLSHVRHKSMILRPPSTLASLSCLLSPPPSAPSLSLAVSSHPLPLRVLVSLPIPV